MSDLVELVDVVKIYDHGAARALDGVSLRLGPGEFTALMGPSGSGKSTLLNLIAGLDRATSGKVTVAGQSLGDLGEADLARFRRERLGIVFQFFQLLNHLTVMENVMLPARLAGRPPRVARARAEELLSGLGLADRMAQYPGRLSGGQQQVVAIARALVNEPILVLADEPTGAIDGRSGEDVMELLVQLNRRGQTIFLVTHDPKLATRYARRVVSLVDGQVVGDTELASSPAKATEVISFCTYERRAHSEGEARHPVEPTPR